MAEVDGAGIDPALPAEVVTPATGAEDAGRRCATEAAASVAGESPSDSPVGVSPSIAAFVRAWSDGLPRPDRDALIPPLLARLPATRGSEATERRRVALAADWLLRTHLPAWFNLAKLHIEADELADLPELADLAGMVSLRDHLKRARKRAAVANLTLRQAGAAVRAAAWDATHRAAWGTVRDGLEAAGPEVHAAGWDAAYAAAYAATRAYGKAPLEPTRLALQRSAVALVERMIAARDPAAIESAERGIDTAGQHPSDGVPLPPPVAHGTAVRP